MSLVAERPGPATVSDLLAIPETQRFHELIDGELIQKANPSGEHGAAQAALATYMNVFFGYPPGGSGPLPGGWWFATEVEIAFAPDQVYRPDVVGWRRDRVPEQPGGTPISIRPDWVSEVLSPSNASQDTVKKLNRYHLFRVPHYWIADPIGQTLTVYRWHVDGYLAVLATDRSARVRAEPFDAVELPVSVVFGDSLLLAEQLRRLLAP